jgi:hypothetical protein
VAITTGFWVGRWFFDDARVGFILVNGFVVTFVA